LSERETGLQGDRPSRSSRGGIEGGAFLKKEEKGEGEKEEGGEGGSWQSGAPVAPKCDQCENGSQVKKELNTHKREGE